MIDVLVYFIIPVIYAGLIVYWVMAAWYKYKDHKKSNKDW